MNEFASLLTRLRERAGYPTARKFYMSVGGRKALPCTYTQYLNIESGRSSPRPKIIEALVMLLRIWEDPETSREFCRAYLEAHFGPGEFVGFLVRSLGRDPAAAGLPGAPLRKAMAANNEARAVPTQGSAMNLIRSSPTHYWAFHVVNSDSGTWTPERVAQALKMPAKPVRRALSELAAQGLVGVEKDGSFSGLFRGKYLLHTPQAAPESIEVPQRMPETQRLWDHMGKKYGKTLFHQGLFMRASESELRSSYPFLAQSVHGLAVYETTDKKPDTSLLVAETRVRRLLPF